MAMTTLIAGIVRDLIRRLDLRYRCDCYRGVNAEIAAAIAAHQSVEGPMDSAAVRARRQSISPPVEEWPEGTGPYGF